MKSHINHCIQSILAARSEALSKTWDHEFDKNEKDQILKKIYTEATRSLEPDDQNRIINELEKLGPIEDLILDPNITEIIVNQHNQVLYEKNGKLSKADDFFFNQTTYHDCIERICQLCGSYINREKPFIETQIGSLRITIVYGDLARGSHLLSIRKQSDKMITLDTLRSWNWCTDFEFNFLKKIVADRKNFLVVGGTSSGKTTLLQALIGEIDSNCRSLLIEDTQELKVINELSTSLITRANFSNPKSNVTMTDLLKRALRLRPDRLIVGEIRGGEATDLLMALSTGHEGSFGSLHAKNHAEALLRLEMLIQMGAPQWKHQSIQKLIGLTVDYIIVVKKENQRRFLEGIYKITSVESHGISSMKIESDSDLN